MMHFLTRFALEAPVKTGVFSHDVPRPNILVPA